MFETTANVVTIGGGLAALVLYNRARRNSRLVVDTHLQLIESWMAGANGAGRGWKAADITMDQRLDWLNPSGGTSPIASGPILMQMTVGDQVLLGSELVTSLAVMNQRIESFNAQLARAEALKAADVVILTDVYARVRNSLSS
jgi:hypothetical protein